MIKINLILQCIAIGKYRTSLHPGVRCIVNQFENNIQPYITVVDDSFIHLHREL